MTSGALRSECLNISAQHCGRLLVLLLLHIEVAKQEHLAYRGPQRCAIESGTVSRMVLRRHPPKPMDPAFGAEQVGLLPSMQNGEVASQKLTAHPVQSALETRHQFPVPVGSENSSDPWQGRDDQCRHEP